jgi:hypothetical protein
MLRAARAAHAGLIEQEFLCNNRSGAESQHPRNRTDPLPPGRLRRDHAALEHTIVGPGTIETITMVSEPAHILIYDDDEKHMNESEAI